MKFTRTVPNENYFRRWISEGGRWELGFTQMLFGVRVRLGQTGLGYCEIDLCAGPSPDRQEEILRLVMLILLPLGEDIDPAKLCRRFPSFSIKPIFNDPNWPELELAASKALHEASTPTAIL